MRNYVAVVFDDSSQAYDGLRALWRLDDLGRITVHGAVVVHRDSLGQLLVDTKDTHLPFATALGAGVGALLGALAGPAGATAGAGGGAVVGAALGGTTGLAVDLDRADTREQALYEAPFVISRGEHAILADVSEDWTSDIDSTMKPLGGKIYRRSRSDVRDDAWFGDYPYDYYLYPYYYAPEYPARYLYP